MSKLDGGGLFFAFYFLVASVFVFGANLLHQLCNIVF